MSRTSFFIIKIKRYIFKDGLPFIYCNSKTPLDNNEVDINMTEGKISEQFQENIESNEVEEKEGLIWGTLVTKSHVRLKIWQILELFGELNVTEISNLLEESKSTVSRHLKSMEQDKLVNSRKCEAICDGRINPKLYSINYEIKCSKSNENQEEGLPTDFAKRIKFILTEIQTNRSSITMIKGIMDLLLPIYEEVEDLIKIGTPEALQKADKIFMEYMWGPEGKHITWFLFLYLTPEMKDLRYRIEKWAYKGIEEENFDSEKFEEERLQLKKEYTEAKSEQEDPLVKKKYAKLGIDLPLRKIFKKNLKFKKDA